MKQNIYESVFSLVRYQTIDVELILDSELNIDFEYGL